MAHDTIPDPTGHIKLCCNRTLSIKNECFIPFMLMAILIGCCGILCLFITIPIAVPISVKNNIPLCNDCQYTFNNITGETKKHCEFKTNCNAFISIISIPIGLLIIGCGCYVFFLSVLFLQKSESCMKCSILSEYLKNNLCLPFLCCPIYYRIPEDPLIFNIHPCCGNSSNYICADEWALLSCDKKNAFIIDVCHIRDHSEKLCCSWLSCVLIPFTIFAYPLIIIGHIFHWIWKGCTYCYNKIKKEWIKTECTWNNWNCCDCCIISKSEPVKNNPIS